MKTAIFYSTKYGSTEKVANEIALNLNIEKYAYNVGQDIPDINKFDTIILGFPIYAGITNRDFRNFIQNNWNEIKPKLIGLFILCLDESSLDDYFRRIFPDRIPSKIIRECIGAEINPDILMDVEKSIIFNLIGVDKKTSTISKEKILSFSNRISEKLGNSE
ncbi:MAG: flavodoxin domain-containing protein [Bacteroidota bacterium]